MPMTFTLVEALLAPFADFYFDAYVPLEYQHTIKSETLERLKQLTGQDFGFDYAQWANWFDDNPDYERKWQEEFEQVEARAKAEGRDILEILAPDLPEFKSNDERLAYFFGI